MIRRGEGGGRNEGEEPDEASGTGMRIEEGEALADEEKAGCCAVTVH